MDQSRLDNLVRLASEIDELERGTLAASPESSSHAPGLRLVGRSSSRHQKRERIWKLKVAALATAAACLGLVARLALEAAVPTPAPGPRGIASNLPGSDSGSMQEPAHADSASTAQPIAAQTDSSAAAASIVDAGNTTDEASIVLGIFEDAAGVVRCVKWRAHDFGGRDLDDVRPGELTAATYGHQCVIGPHKVIAVGLSGPRSELPETDAQAQAVAQCIMGFGPQTCEVHPAPFDNKDVACLPHGLKVVVETLAMGK